MVENDGPRSDGNEPSSKTAEDAGEPPVVSYTLNISDAASSRSASYGQKAVKVEFLDVEIDLEVDSVDLQEPHAEKIPPSETLVTDTGEATDKAIGDSAIFPNFFQNLNAAKESLATLATQRTSLEASQVSAVDRIVEAIRIDQQFLSRRIESLRRRVAAASKRKYPFPGDDFRDPFATRPLRISRSSRVDRAWTPKEQTADPQDQATSMAELSNLVPPARAEEEQNAHVTPPTREEIDAKLQLVEANMDRRVAELVGRMDVRDAEQKAQFEAMFRELRANSEQTVATRREVRAATIALVSLIIASALAIVFGLTGVLSNMLSSFESGRNTGAAIGAATEQLKTVADRLDKQAQLPAAPASR